MPNTLYIKKTTNGYFEFTVNGDFANTISNTRNDLTSIGDQLHFKTSNGANLIQKQEIYPSDLTLEYDSTIISSFSTVPAVFSGLIDAGFFAWIIGSGSGGGGVDKFEDLLDTFNYTGHNGMTVKVNETLQRLEPVAYRLTEKFTDLDDTPGNIIANKMVITNAAGDGLEYAEIPSSQETNLNSVGYFIYQDLITQTTPISFSSGTDTKITNDTNGTGTDSSNAPFGIAKIWDSDLNQIDLSGCQVGDTVDLRIRLDTTTSSSNQLYKIKFKTAIGSIDEELVTIFTQTTKTAGIDSQTFNILFPVSSDNIKNNPSEIYISSDNNGSVKVNKFYFRVIQKDINIIQLGQEGLDLKEDKINKIDTVTGVSSIKYISEKCLVEYVASNAPVTPDATNTIKGKLKLAGDLGGTADLPTVPGLADKEFLSNKIDSISGNSSSKYTTENAVKTYADSGDAATLISANTYTDSKVSAVYRWKGSVANFAALPSSGQVIGDVWNATDTNMNYGWTGSIWDPLGSTVDISGKEDKINKSDDIETNKASSIIYTSAKAVVIWIKTYLISNLSAKATTLIDADFMIIGDSEDSSKTKTRTFAQLKATLKTYFDGFYGNMTTNTAQNVPGIKTVQSRWNFKEPDNISTNRGFQIVTRDVGLAFPAISAQATDGTNTNTAFDVMPKGNPSDYSIYGAAWLHVCNKDCLDTNPDFNALRMGAASNKVTISSDKFGANPNLPLEIQMSGTAIATFGIDNSTSLSGALTVSGIATFTASSNSGPRWIFQNLTPGTSSSSGIRSASDTAAIDLIAFSSTYTGITGASNTSWIFANSGSNELILNAQKSTGKIRFMTAGTVLASNTAGIVTENKKWRLGDGNTPTEVLEVAGNVLATQFKLSALNTAPASSTAIGTTGEIRIVNGFIYVCVATNTWQRTALSTF